MARSKLHLEFARSMQTLFPKNPYPRVLIACSGGVDSMALVDLTCHYYNRVGKTNLLERVQIAHLNHGQRPPAETKKDAELVRALCQKWNLTPFILNLDVKAGASEAELRHHRFLTLARLAAGSSFIVLTAHHAQDDLETYLFRALRGAHPTTLQGIAPRAKRALSQGITLKLARPLLKFTKSDLLKYATTQNVSWNEDSTNASQRYARNRIRSELIPLFESLRPGATRRLHLFFHELQDQRPRKIQIHKQKLAHIIEKLQSDDGLLARESDFYHLKAALDALLGDYSHRTTQAHWNNLKRHLANRHATRHSSGPAKLLEFPGGNRLKFLGNKLYWVANS